jgi:hypothetical protein
MQPPIGSICTVARKSIPTDTESPSHQRMHKTRIEKNHLPE